MTRAGTAALAAGLAIVVAGCGGNDDRQKIEATVHEYFGAFADGNAAKACADLAKATREEFVKASRAKGCVPALSQAMQRPEIKRFTAQLRDAKVVSVQIKGDNATASVRALGTTTKVQLRKEGDSWRVGGKVGG